MKDEPIQMNTLETRASFSDEECVFVHNYLNTIQRLVRGLGSSYHAMWRTFFHDARPFSEFLDRREILCQPHRKVYLWEKEDVPTKTVSLKFDIPEKGSVQNEVQSFRDAVIRQLCSMTDEEIQNKINRMR